VVTQAFWGIAGLVAEQTEPLANQNVVNYSSSSITVIPVSCHQIPPNSTV